MFAYSLEMVIKRGRGDADVVKAGGAAAALELVRQSVSLPERLLRRDAVLLRPAQVLSEEFDILLDRNAVLLKQQIELFPHG